MVLRAGQNQRRVSIQTASEGRASGSVTRTYSHQLWRYAQIVAGSGNERIEGDKVASSVTHTAQFRYDSTLATTLTAGSQIVDGSLTLRVEAVTNPDQRSVELVAACRETA